MQTKNKKEMSCQPYGRQAYTKASSRSVGMRDIKSLSVAAPIPRIETLRGDEGRRYGMTNGASGFTLIELLVVVLIIGILAAIALPQYQKAVEKSKATQAITILKSAYQAAEAYYLATGTWPNRFDELSLNIPWTGNVQADTNWGGQAVSNEAWSLQSINAAAYKGIFITRLSGKYTGGQFVIWKKHESALVPTDTFLCSEKKKGTYKIESAGLFCKKLFRGTYIVGGDINQLYTFPL